MKKSFVCFEYNCLQSISSQDASLRNYKESTTPKYVTPKIIPSSPTYPWNEKEQGILLGAFFWLHWLTQIPGGILASKYGTKLVFGLSNFMGVILALLIPSAASFGYNYLLLLRVIQGILTVGIIHNFVLLKRQFAVSF